MDNRQPRAYRAGQHIKRTLTIISFGLILLLVFVTLEHSARGVAAESGDGVGELTSQAVANSLGGSVYVDANNNGLRDSSEAGIAGVVITLSGNDNTNTAVNRIITTGTDGTYLFTNLIAGTYNLIETQPVGYNDGSETVGTLGGDAGTNDVIGGIILPVGGSGSGYNFGEKQTTTPSASPSATGSLAGTVYLDSNADGQRGTGEQGIANVTITLTGLDTNGVSVQRTATSATDGRYSFTALPPGIYSLSENQPMGYGDGKASSGSLGGEAGTNQTSGIVVPAGANGTGYDFGDTQASTVPTKVTPTTRTIAPTSSVSVTPSVSPTTAGTVTPTRTTTPSFTPTPIRTATPTGTATPSFTATPVYTPTPRTTPAVTPTTTVRANTPTAAAASTGTPGKVRALDIQKINDKPGAQAGDTVKFTITISNPNTQPATSVVVIDDLPVGLSLQSASGGGSMTLNNGRLVFNIGTIPAGGATSVTVTTIMIGTGGAVINTASYTALVEGQAFSGSSLSGIGAPTLPNTGTGNTTQTVATVALPLFLLTLVLGVVVLLGAGSRRRKR